MLDHTPLPWAIEQVGDSYYLANRDFEGDEWDIGEIYTQGNAEFIVRACSAHDDLLNACKLAAVNHSPDCATKRRAGACDCHVVLALGAISKAERKV